jgi:hypothetical protein
LYDTIRRDWASKFGNISNLKLPSKSKPGSQSLILGESTELFQGWALHASSFSDHFPENVRDYLIAKFNEGEKLVKKLILLGFD